jgi:hypothetical protein
MHPSLVRSAQVCARARRVVKTDNTVGLFYAVPPTRDDARATGRLGDGRNWTPGSTQRLSCCTRARAMAGSARCTSHRGSGRNWLHSHRPARPETASVSDGASRTRTGDLLGAIQTVGRGLALFLPSVRFPRLDGWVNVELGPFESTQSPHAATPPPGAEAQTTADSRPPSSILATRQSSFRPKRDIPESRGVQKGVQNSELAVGSENERPGLAGLS